MCFDMRFDLMAKWMGEKRSKLVEGMDVEEEVGNDGKAM